MNNLYYGHMFGWGFGGGLMMLFLVVIAILIIWAVREVKNSGHSYTSRSRSALDILKERYARGEIDKREFEEKRKDLIS